MRLSYICSKINLAGVIIDSEFDDLGLLATISDGLMLSFLEDSKYVEDLRNNSSISCIITNETISQQILDILGNRQIGIAVSASPRSDFFNIHNYLIDHTDFYYSNKQSIISDKAKIEKSASIAGNNVEIDENSYIGHNVVIHPNVKIGKNVHIGDGSIIGADGFECFRDADRIINVKHAGGVFIDNNVNIHSNVCIDKGLFRNNTIIGQYVSIDNFVHIAHNVIIGERTRIAANAVISGRTIVGKDVWIGPSVTITNGIKIGNGCSLTIGSVVTKSVPDGKVVMWKLAF